MSAVSGATKGFAKWATINTPHFVSQPPVATSFRPKFNQNTNFLGAQYRDNSMPRPSVVTFFPRYTRDTCLAAGFKELDPDIAKSEYTFCSTDKIARLAHGLESTLRRPGIHFTKNPISGELLLPDSVQKLHQPIDIDYDRMPAFIPPRKDKV